MHETSSYNTPSNYIVKAEKKRFVINLNLIRHSDVLLTGNEPIYVLLIRFIFTASTFID